ncbi:MAG: sulfatase [Kiritimatiellia bacterium]
MTRVLYTRCRDAILAGFLFSATVGCLEAATPNVLVLLVDDLGWKDLSCTGSDFYETPNIDALAKSGVLFSQAYAASPVCSPTRASLLTGQYPARIGHTHIVQAYGRWPASSPLTEPDWVPVLPLEAVTLAEMLKPAGYTTAHIGKWHLGGRADQPRTPEADPLNQGFDLNIGGTMEGQPPDYFFPYERTLKSAGKTLRLGKLPPGKLGDYLTEVLTDSALDFLDVQAGQKLPFFLEVNFFTVHTSTGDRLQARADKIAKYQEKAAGMPPGDQRNPVYAAMVEHLDEAVGRIVQRLDKLGMRENTILFLLSDNGGHGGKTSMRPLRGAKSSAYEGGIRVPALVSWPGRVPAGTVSDTPVHSIDLFPTVLDLLGIAASDEPIDGVSLKALLLNSPDLDLNRPLFWHNPHYYPHAAPHSAVRYGDYRLIEFLEEGRLELYNLQEDPGEQVNLADREPGKRIELQQMLDRWRTDVGAPMPGRKQKEEE